MRHRFGAFELDERLFELSRQGELVPLPRRSFDLLLYLVKRRGVVVSKDELLDEVWSGVAVTKDVLPQAMMLVRSALGDDVESPIFIQTVRGRGYRFLPVVERASLVPVDAPSGRPRLFGRATGVLSSLQARVGRTLVAREGGLILVTATAGMGKTHLLAELTRATTGVTAISVLCYGGPGVPVLWPFAQAMEELARRGVSLDPDLATLATGELEEESVENPAKRFRLVERIVRALTTFADRTPLLLVIDDLHLADPHSVGLLELLAPRLATSPLVVVAAYNAASIPSSSTTAFAALTHGPATSVVSLEPFKRDDLAAYLEAALGTAPSSSVLDKVFEKTQGNPLFVSEIVHVLSATDRLREEVTTTSLVGSDGMREAIVHLLASLPPAVTRVLETAAVFGRRFPLAPLAASLETTNAEVLRELDRAHEERVVEPTGNGEYRFTYPLVRDVLYRRLPAFERARLHGLAAHALEDHLGGSSEHDRIGEISEHLVQAAPLGEVAVAVDWALRAAELAAAAGDHVAASRYAERGLDAFRFWQKPDAARRERLLAVSGRRE